MSKRIAILGTFTVLSALASTFVAERDAQACGGCFPPPGETNSVVTDHRMILSVSTTQTTLYDQIRYSGNPSSFAWVLPISGEATVGLSSDTLFQVLDNVSTPRVLAPPTNCPPQPSNCRSLQSPGSASAENDSSGGGGVIVTKSETVGPYATVQLKSTDPEALNSWLTTNGFGISDDVKPVVAQYVREQYDFLAMKLIPGATVKSMRPVRITTRGASPVLPLRMVAAGTGATVGITLWILGDGRWDPKNFSTFRIQDEEIVWDWATQKSNYATLRADKTKASNGLAWELESSIAISQGQVRNPVQNAPNAIGNGVDDYLPIDDTGTPAQAREADLTTLFNGVAQSLRLTRIRADLSRAGLASDLQLVAGDQGVLPNQRQAKQESGQPQCTVWEGCTANGTAPRDEAIRRSSASGGDSFSCATSVNNDAGLAVPVTLGGIAAFLGLALVRARRKRS